MREHLGRRVRVHFNLRTGQWSVASAERGAPRTLIGHAAAVTLAECVPKVSASGVARIRRRRQREVVAWVIGTLVAYGDEPDPIPSNAARVTFNPFRASHFYRASDGTEWCGAELGVFRKGELWTA